MIKFSEIINKQRITSLEIIRALKEEFINRGYKPSRKTASDFAKNLEVKYPGVNQWISKTCGGRDIEDVIMDEFRIP